MKIQILLILAILALTACSEAEFRQKYEREIREEIKEVVKESVKEAITSTDLIELPKDKTATGRCTLSEYQCIDFIVEKNTITFQLENKGPDFIVTDYLISKCTTAKTNQKSGNYQMIKFENCQNGDKGSNFEQGFKLILNNNKTVSGTIKTIIE